MVLVSLNSPSSAVNKRSKRLVSYDVFMKYVVESPLGGVDVSGVFSHECFQEWIMNRKKCPKEPEESFRKALVAHVSGKDDRKPFDERVEENILKRLRESEPWPCFQTSENGAHKIGERGLKRSSLGFHEEKRKKLQTQQSDFSVSPLSSSSSHGMYRSMGSSPTVNLSQYSNHMQKYGTVFNPMEIQNMALNNFNPFSFSALNYQQQKVSTPQIAQSSEQQLKAAACDKVEQILQKCFSTEKTNSTELAKSLAACYTTAELKDILEADMRESEIWTHEVLFHLDNNLHAFPFCEEDFIIPSIVEQCFNPAAKKGVVMMSHTSEIFQANAFAEDILQKIPLIGTLYISFFYAAVHRAIVSKCAVPQMCKNNTAWFRLCAKMADGTLKVLLLHLERGSKDRLIKVSFQDVSEDYTLSLQRARMTLNTYRSL